MPNLDQKLNRLTDLVEGPQQYLDMVAEVAPCAELADYLDHLNKRLERWSQPLNQIRELPGAIYAIENYDYAMYQWFVGRHFKASVVTPSRLYIPQGELTSDERRQFQKRIR